MIIIYFVQCVLLGYGLLIVPTNECDNKAFNVGQLYQSKKNELDFKTDLH